MHLDPFAFTPIPNNNRKNSPPRDPAPWTSLSVMITMRIFYFLFGHKILSLPVSTPIIILLLWRFHTLLTPLVHPLFGLVASPSTLPVLSHLTLPLPSPHHPGTRLAFCPQNYGPRSRRQGRNSKPRRQNPLPIDGGPILHPSVFAASPVFP